MAAPGALRQALIGSRHSTRAVTVLLPPCSRPLPATIRANLVRLPTAIPAVVDSRSASTVARSVGTPASPKSILTLTPVLRPRSPVATIPAVRVSAGVAKHLYATQLKNYETDKTPESATPVNRDPTQLEQEQQMKDAAKSPKNAVKLNLRARLSKEKEAPQNLWQSLGEVGRLLRIAQREKKMLSAAIALLVVSSGITLSVPAAIGKIMNAATTTSAEDTLIFGLPLEQFFPAFALFLSLGAFANFGRIVLLRTIGERVVANLRSTLFRKAVSQDAEFFDANRVGDLMSRLGSDAVIVGKSISQNLSDGLRSLIGGVAAISLMVWTSFELTSIILLTGPLLAAGSFFYAKVLRTLSRNIQRALGRASKVAEERLGNVRTSQAFVSEARELREYNVQNKEVFRLGVRQSFIDAAYWSWTGWTGNMLIIALLWFGGGMVRDGIMNIGDLTTFMMYALWAGTSMSGFSAFLSELSKGTGAASRLFELQDRMPATSATRGVKVPSAQGPIKFENVAFAYPLRPDAKLFNGLNFEIPWGSNVCIVGPSGGGKSTIAQLLARFYEPTEGKITINGMDISKMNAKSLRRRISMVAQEPVLYSGTIASNIKLGRPNATHEEVLEAARKANCTFIYGMPQSFDTQVGARGSQLSGGQKQRIAIARALIKNPDILILDEATSALDAESETAVNAALAQLLRGNNTTISIAHRMSTIARSDRVIVLNRIGTVEEVGSFAELNADPNSAFRRLMDFQVGKEVVGNNKQDHRPADPEAEDEADIELSEEELNEEPEELQEEAVVREGKKSKE